MNPDGIANLEEICKKHPYKFIPEKDVYRHIHRGDSLFIGTACAEPQYLINGLVNYIDTEKNDIFGAAVIQVWTLGIAPYNEGYFEQHFRHNSFFISDKTRDAVNSGMADYTPIFLSEVPDLFKRGVIPIDVALVQVSLPDTHGNFSLGVSVDIVKSAVENASLVIAQVNSNMPMVYGDTFIHADHINFLVCRDEPLIEITTDVPDDIAEKIGQHVAKLVQNGDTIQVGYGSIPNAILSSLGGKKDLGVHTELLSDGIASLMMKGVITNKHKTVNRGKTIATFCMGSQSTYEYINCNPDIEFRAIDYTNNSRIISSHNNMVAINSCLELDLTGQATAESISGVFYSGTGGQTDFMRSALKSPGGKSILVLRSTTNDGKVSRIVPRLSDGAGVTLQRGDIHYVITEYGIAHLHAKNIRERTMALIAIAHPDFRPWLIEKAKEYRLIYKDQAFVPGKAGEYPEHLETRKTTKGYLDLFLRPVKITDEDLLKEFFYSLSDKSIYRRFITSHHFLPHSFLQKFVIIDYTRQMTILAMIKKGEREIVAGIGQYTIMKDLHTADIAFAVGDDFHNQGICRMLLQYLSTIAIREGLLGFTGDVMPENKPMLHVLETSGFKTKKTIESGMYEIIIEFAGI